MTEERINEAVELLKSYRDLLSVAGAPDVSRERRVWCRDRMALIRHAIKSMPPVNTSLLLSLRYVDGFTTEQCALRMGISRRTSFRLLTKAHEEFCRALYEEGYWPEEENRRMKERLEEIINRAKEAHTAYVMDMVMKELDEDQQVITEATFIAEALIEAGVCFRLSVPKKEVQDDR